MMHLQDAKRARLVAGVGGVLYLIIIVLGIIVLGALDEAVVRGDLAHGARCLTLFLSFQT